MNIPDVIRSTAYIQKDNGCTTIIVVYVDDQTIASTSIDRINLFKKTLSGRFDMKDLGEVKYLLKIKIIRDRKKKTMTLSQHKYIEDVLHRFDMTDTTTHLAPQVPGEKLVADIANAVRTFSKFLLSHDKTHWTAALQVLKYLKETSTYGLVYDGSLDDKITYQLFSDASFANTDEQIKSVTGYCVMMAG